MQLGQMEALRRAHNLRDRQLVFPNRITDAVPARGQLNQEVRITPNSYLWAVNFWEFETPGDESDAAVGAGVAPDHFSLQITDEQSGAEIASEFLSARAFYPNSGNDRLQLAQCLLAQPRIFAGEGLLSIRIANTDSVPHFCQLVLYFLEPCDGALESQQCA
jgi:hypothetical protein